MMKFSISSVTAATLISLVLVPQTPFAAAQETLTSNQRPTTWDFVITGSSPYAGLLTVRPNATAPWGTVCDDYFDLTSALAACRSIFPNASRATIYIASSPYHNTGTGPIYMDDVICPTNSTYLGNCSYIYSTETSINHDCTHAEDVTINCFPDGGQPYYQPPASSWEYKIDGGGASGLLLVRPSSVSPWGTVCDDGFTNREAVVACRSIGYNVTNAVVYYYSNMGTYGYATAPIYMDDVICANSSIGDLADCQYTYSTEWVRRHDCQHYEDVAVDCRGSPPTTTSTTAYYDNGGDANDGDAISDNPILIPIIIVACIVGFTILSGIVAACCFCWGSIWYCFRKPPPPVSPSSSPTQHVAFATTTTTATPYSPTNGSPDAHYTNPPPAAAPINGPAAPHGQHHLIAHQQHQLQHQHLIAHQQHQLQRQEHQHGHHQQHHHHHHHQQPAFTHGGYPSQPQAYVVTQQQQPTSVVFVSSSTNGAVNGSYEMSPITRL